ncbi:hypothetical protein BV372_17390 [Nostoc sp. T09]|uniref:hypothetical protein n=1 Tax=Nostoc sp. T09 TaxID=1932621 RepID=UPI000A3B160F|nr:hypothetical protein [Nostoc sp. T09]OUL33120.1 hypothetical protein BV372_17390 [Nostoc sp. T09]
MKREKANGRKTKVRQKCKNGELNSITRGVGTLSPKSAKTRNDSLGVSRIDSNESDPITIGTGEGIDGGIARQLIEETRKQLAYHKTQVAELEVRLHELEQLTEDLAEDKKNSTTP